MAGKEQKIISLPEITRVEGHSAVVVEICNGKVESVQMQVFEGTRFFEKIVVGHNYFGLPHITSRVCAICSAGHVLAAIKGIEQLLRIKETPLLNKMRELMHLGMIIESHATHLFALVLPDYIGAVDLVDFATRFPREFQNWNQVRSIGTMVQTVIGGRPFHPVNLQVGGLSHYASNDELHALIEPLKNGAPLAVSLAEQLMSYEPKFSRETEPVFVALEPENGTYGYFGTSVRSSDGWKSDIAEYRSYLSEITVPYSHAKRSTFGGKSFMVGSMARLRLHHSHLTGEAANLFKASAMAKGETNTILNNVGQAIELTQAIDRCIELIGEIAKCDRRTQQSEQNLNLLPHGTAIGAVECPRGTLYHSYTFDEHGMVVAADMVTPSAQNTARIERDISEVVERANSSSDAELQSHLETLIRAYDPCNTCATHMVRIRYK